MRMKKIVGFEFSNVQQHEPYSKVSFRMDLRMVLWTVVILLALVVVTAQSSSLEHHHHLEMAKRLSLIKNMTREVWMNQRTRFEPRPIPVAEGRNMIQMLSTFWVMGLRAEYEQAKGWIMANYFDPDFDFVQTHLVATEYMGSLLSCYALTSDTIWLDRAKQIGDKLKFDYDTPTGLPKIFILSKMFMKLNQSFAGTDLDLADAGGQHLEFAYLADMINDLDMKAKLRKEWTFLRNVEKPNDSVNAKHSIDVNTGQWKSTNLSLLWPANAFYQYAIKSYVQSGGKDEQAIEMYRGAIDAVVVNNSVIQKWSQNDLTYAESEQISPKMDYSGCYLGAIFALGANAMQKQLDSRNGPHITDCNRMQQKTRIDQHWTLAKAITELCYKRANSFSTKLPRRYYRDNVFTNEDEFTFDLAAAYAESYFVLWRLTHNPKYRDYAWELAQAIHKHCRWRDEAYQQYYHHYYHLLSVEVEYSRDTFYDSPKLNSLISALKYMYLTFSDDSLLPLDQWVFNRAGQPLPVCGKNPAYPATKCATNKCQ